MWRTIVVRTRAKIPGCSSAIGAALLAASCTRGPDTLDLFFSDELVEAPARTVNLLAVAGADCDALLTRRHEEAGTAGRVILERTVTYPVDPAQKILDGLPRGAPFAVEIAAYDDGALQVARACDVITLDAQDQTTIEIELRALPLCSKSPTALDVQLVLDTSTAMEVADSEKVHLAELNARVVDSSVFPEDTTWSVVTHGHTGSVLELLPPTSDVAEVHAAVDSLRTVHRGTPLLYDALSRAAGLQRARAVCGRRPALLVLLGGVDGGSTKLLEDASIGIIGTRGDASDDIYTFGLGLTIAAYDVLEELIPAEIGIATGAETEFLRKAKLSEAASTLRALIP